MNYTTTTTLNEIKAASPCVDGWKKLLNFLGKTKADDEPLELLTILDINGLSDALWVLDNVIKDDRLIRHFTASCAEQVLHIYERDYPDDNRIRNQIETLRNDDATPEERAAARNAARDSAWNGAWNGALAAAGNGDGALAASRAAEWDAAWDAAWNAAWNGAWNGALAAARNAARNDARAAAWDAARAAEWNGKWNAAWNGALAAARNAARNASRAAEWDAAWAAARNAARTSQEEQFRKMITNRNP